MAQLGVDTNELPEPSGGGPVPLGDYLVQVTEADCVHEDKAQGRRVSLTLEIQDGDFARWKIWERCDIDRIAQTKNGERKIDAARFNQFLQAVGKGGYVEHTDELLGLQCVVRVKIDVYTGNDGQPRERNRVQSYRPAPRQQAAPPPSRPAAQPQRQQAAPAPQQRGPALAGGNRPAPAFMQRKAG